MKKRTALMFSAGLFLIVLAVLIIFLMNGSLKSQGNIVLPQGSAQIEEAEDIARRNRRTVTEITVTTDNVQAVVASLSRPVSYSYAAEKTYYYQNTSSLSVCLVRVSGEFGRVDLFDTDGKVQKQLIYTRSDLYMWGRGDTTYYTSSRDGFTLENEAGLPTYESVLELEADAIVEAGLKEHNGRLCIYLISAYEQGRYTREWYIEIDSGLLYSCDTRDRDRLIWSVVCRDMTIGQQDSALFVLPNGRNLY